MPTYAKTTSVPIARSRAQIDELLQRWNCDAIRWTDDFRRGVVLLEFTWERLEDGEPLAYLARFELRLPTDDALRLEARDGRSGAFSQAKMDKLRAGRGRQEHRILLLWLTAAFNAVDAGLVDAATLFLPFLVGRDGQTVAEAALPRMRNLLRGAAASALGLPERAG